MPFHWSAGGCSNPLSKVRRQITAIPSSQVCQEECSAQLQMECWVCALAKLASSRGILAKSFSEESLIISSWKMIFLVKKSGEIRTLYLPNLTIFWFEAGEFDNWYKILV